MLDKLGDLFADEQSADDAGELLELPFDAFDLMVELLERIMVDLDAELGEYLSECHGLPVLPCFTRLLDLDVVESIQSIMCLEQIVERPFFADRLGGVFHVLAQRDPPDEPADVRRRGGVVLFACGPRRFETSSRST